MDNPNLVLPDDKAALTITGFFPNGFRATYTVAVSLPTAFQEGMEFTSRLAVQGFSMTAPGLENGEERELIMVVMRREKGDGTPIIDFYPTWGAGGDLPFGTYKYVHKYLNNEAEIVDFLAVSGFKSLEDIPLYDGQGSLKRTAGKTHAKETAVPTPFYVVRKQGAEKTGSDGQPYRPWDLLRYESEFTTSADKSTGEINDKPATPKGKPAPANDDAWNTAAVNGLVALYGKSTVQSALNIVDKWSEWTGGAKAAGERVATYLQENVPF